MNVQPIYSGPVVSAYVRGERHAPAHRQAPGAAAAHTADPQPSTPVAPPDEATHELAIPVKGVLQRLEEGHFRGVADVRLRINFSQELQALHTSPFGSESNDPISTLRDDFAALAGDTLLPADRTEEADAAFARALSAFETAARDTLQSYSAAESPDPAERDQALKAVFGEFIAATEEAFVPEPAQSAQPSGAAPEGEVAEQAYPKEIPSELAVFMSEMTSIFSEAMGKMTDLPSLSDRLPALSEPQGQGGAYEKFVTEYSRQRSAPVTSEYLNLQG